MAGSLLQHLPALPRLHPKVKPHPAQLLTGKLPSWPSCDWPPAEPHHTLHFAGHAGLAGVHPCIRVGNKSLMGGRDADPSHKVQGATRVRNPCKLQL